jgi:DNA/RNA endonuclease G (NUC1)
VTTGWDRGHLTPFKAMAFSQTSAAASNLYTNVAPQDPYTNQAPWKKLEMATYKGSGIQGLDVYVWTGVCGQQGTIGLNQITIPLFFWKVLCTQDKSGTTYTIGFNAPNSQTPPTQKDQRKKTVLTRLSAGAATANCNPNILNVFGMINGFGHATCLSQDPNTAANKVFWDKFFANKL